MERLFFEDGAALAEWAVTRSVEEAEAGEQESAQRAAEALGISQVAHEKEILAQRNANGLSDDLVRLRTEHEQLTKGYYRQAFFDADTVDHALAAEESAKRNQVISAMSSALVYGRESLAPGLRLNVLQADATLYREHAQLASWSAGKSAVKRHILAVPLGNAEGGISFGNFGRTYELLQASLVAHKRASDMAEAVQLESARQRARKELL